MKPLKKILLDHSNEELTTASVIGVLGVVVCVAKAAPKVKEVYERDIQNGASKKEIVKDILPICVPSIVCTGTTITCIVLNGVMNQKYKATTAALLTSANGTVVKLQDKITEVLGGDAADKIKTAIAQEDVDEHPVSKAKAAGQIENTGTGTDLFRDGWSGRYFLANRAFVDDAIARYNQSIYANEGGVWAELNALYGYLNLSSVECGVNVGYNVDDRLDISMVPTVTDDGQGTCFVMMYNNRPCDYRGKKI